MHMNLVRKIYKPILNKYDNYKKFKAFKIEKNKIKSLLLDEDFSNIINNNPCFIKEIAFIIPGMSKFSGGHTSILRLGSELATKGYNIHYVSFINQPIDVMNENAKSNLENYKGIFHNYDTVKSFNFDLVIATNWESVFFAKKMSGYKMYFVQDYEPYFYRYGENYLLAKKTYEFGFHIVSLGKWNLKKIKEECEQAIKGDFVTFPYESNEYRYLKRNFEHYSQKKCFQIAIYIKDDGKRFPFLIQAMIENVNQELKKDGISIKPVYFGIYNEYEPDFGINMGKLSKKELEKLYRESDFGMVASLTNISLIPFEMMGTGLPVIEFAEGTFLDFFDSKSAIVTSMNYKDLYTKLKQVILSPKELEEITERAYKNISSTSWESTANEFEEILKGVLK